MSSSLGSTQGRWFAVVLLLFGCRDVKPDQSTPSPKATRHAEVADASAPRAAGAAEPKDAGLDAFRRVFGLSEVGEAFISDNVVSNETSLLEPAAALKGLRGGVYIGVGPEQNYTYIALSRPEYAILIDLRRDNALLHLLYKSIFELAHTRLEFLCLLLGRPYVKEDVPLAANAPVDELLDALSRSRPDRGWYGQRHQRLAERISSYGLGLSRQDIDRIEQLHQLFFERQLELRFELRDAHVRSYPTIGQLLRLRSSSGHGTFLADAASFEFVQNLHRRHLIVPVVGDVSAKRPFFPIADELRQRGLVLRTFYISNVEQYLVGQPSYRGWIDTLRQLPHDEHSVLLRCYLDQGRRHPRQQPGSRTTTIVHSLNAFLERSLKRPYASFYKIVTDESLDAKPSE